MQATSNEDPSDIDKRQQILLSSNAPAPDSITQIVSAGDATGDGKADFFVTVGKAGTSGGVDLNSPAAAANSAKGVDEQYGASAWATSNIRLLVGTPDANKDGIPDI
jgi:hypothetical protein